MSRVCEIAVASGVLVNTFSCFSFFFWGFLVCKASKREAGCRSFQESTGDFDLREPLKKVTGFPFEEDKNPTWLTLFCPVKLPKPGKAREVFENMMLLQMFCSAWPFPRFLEFHPAVSQWELPSACEEKSWTACLVDVFLVR